MSSGELVKIAMDKDPRKSNKLVKSREHLDRACEFKCPQEKKPRAHESVEPSKIMKSSQHLNSSDMSSMMIIR